MRLLIFIIALMLASCSRTVFIPSISRDTVRLINTQIDTLRTSDTVSVYVREKGDTLTICKYVTRWKDRVSLKVDTVYISRVDTVSVIKEVGKSLNVWQRMQLNTWWPISAVLAVLLVIIRFKR